MPTFDDLGDALSPTLDLPIGGTVYKIPSPPARIGLALQAASRVAQAQREGVDPRESDVRAAATVADTLADLGPQLLGPAWDDLVESAPIAGLRRVVTTVHLWVLAGEDVAARYWTGSPAADQLTAESTQEG